jgi:N-formylmaleamate deformylase
MARSVRRHAAGVAGDGGANPISDLPNVGAETLLLYAEKGGTVSDADADEIVRVLRKGRKQRIDGAGHMIPWDQLDRFVEAVQSFLSV